MELIDKIRNKVSKKEFMFICLFSVMFVFNYFVFNQFDILLNNPAEFGVTTAEIIGVFILFSVIIIIVSIAGLTVLCSYSKRGFVYTLAALLGLTLAGYAQVLFMNEDVVRAVMPIEYLGKYILNTIVYLLIIAAPIGIVFFERKKKKGFTPRLALLITIVILGMQLVGLMSVAASAPQAAKNNELYYFSVDEQLKLSKNDNIIVFVMDMMDTRVTDVVFAQNPETKEIFDGFTYYTDNISLYPKTFPSITSMLTGKIFDGNTGNQIKYMQDAWKDEILLSALKDKDYIINGLLESTTTFYDFDDLEGKFDNIKTMHRKNRIIKGAKFFNGMFSYGLMRQSPILLKPLTGYWKGQSSNSVEIKNTPDYYSCSTSASADLKFYDKLVQNGLFVDPTEEKNVFSFVHLRASHSPYVYNEELKRTKSNVHSQTRGAFKILNEYFTQMKDPALDIYDNSTIIVLADHGGVSTGENDIKITHPPMTSLLVKESVKRDPKGKAGEPFRNPQEQPQLSHSNFVDTILEIIGDDDKKTVGSYNDVINGITSNGVTTFEQIKGVGIQTREFYFVRYLNLGSSKFFCRYEILGRASEIANWRRVD